ncbi:Lactate utilization protein A [bacterium HR28]|uniref:Glycolate oxidase iron-sulfur subunit n=1 Tax=Thermomicrobium roseum TaxID=500 RepID=A0A7C1XPT7_THERO|nr:Lactate utilization protein A [bacterium HR28]
MVTVPESTRVRGFSGRDAPSFDLIRKCVHCGFCLPSCPTYRITWRERSSPRGRIWLMKSVAEGRLDLLDPVFAEEMQLCLNCRACEAVCPSGVHYGQILEASRAQLVQHRPQSLRERLYRVLGFRILLGDMRRFRAANKLLRWYQRSPVRMLVRRSGVLRALGLEHAEAMLPTIPERFVVPDGRFFPAENERRGRVALFTGCVMSTAYAHVHEATIRVLTRNGFDVVLVSGQQCCGALHVHSGEPELGRDLARRNIEALESPYLDAIIVNAAGCGAMLKEYPQLLNHDHSYAERARALAAKVRDVLEFLVERGLTAQPGALPWTVTYQEPCHLAHAQRITQQPRVLLRAIPQLRLVEMAESALCCGSAGIYNLLQPDMASALLERKLDNALATGAEVIVSANPGCMLQLEAGLRARGLRVPVLHLIEVLDRAYTAATVPAARALPVAAE